MDFTQGRFCCDLFRGSCPFSLSYLSFAFLFIYSLAPFRQPLLPIPIEWFPPRPLDSFEVHTSTQGNRRITKFHIFFSIICPDSTSLLFLLMPVKSSFSSFNFSSTISSFSLFFMLQLLQSLQLSYLSCLCVPVSKQSLKWRLLKSSLV